MVRGAASGSNNLSEPPGAYVGKVRQQAFTVTDEDIAALRKAQYWEYQIFEGTVSAPLGAGLVGFQSGIAGVRVSTKQPANVERVYNAGALIPWAL